MSLLCSKPFNGFPTPVKISPYKNTHHPIASPPPTPLPCSSSCWDLPRYLCTCSLTSFQSQLNCCLLSRAWWLSGKEFTCQCRRCRFHPWAERVPWRRMVHLEVLSSHTVEAWLEEFWALFTNVWDECNCALVSSFFGIAFLRDWNESWPFPVLRLLLSFPNLLAYWVQYFHSIIF